MNLRLISPRRDLGSWLKKIDLTQWIKHNPWLKLVALLVAVAVWYLGSREVYEKGIVRAPVIVTAPEGYTVISTTPEWVDIEVEYPRDDVRRGLEDMGIQVVHELEDTLTPGTLDFSLADREVELPPRFRVLAIAPPRVQIRLDRLMDKVLSVKARLIGEPRPGYRVDGISVTPREVNVVGPASTLEEMNEIMTLPIRMTGRAASFGAARALAPLAGVADMDPATVSLYLTISPEYKVRRFTEVPVRVMSAAGIPEGVTVEPQEVTVFIEAPEKKLEGIKGDRIGAYVEVMDLAPGSYDLPLNVRPPEGSTLQKAEPNVIKVRIQPGLTPRI